MKTSPGDGSDKAYVGAFERLASWPEFFNVNQAARMLGVENDVASIYIARWKKRGFVISAGPRAGMHFNLIANRAAADERLVDALLMEFPTAVLIGESVLHNAGWVTQIPQKLQVAVLSRQSLPKWDSVEFHARSRTWFATHHQRFLSARKSRFATFGLPALKPEDALADMFAHEGHWRPDEDDLAIPDDAGQTVLAAFNQAGVEPPFHLNDSAGNEDLVETGSIPRARGR